MNLRSKFINFLWRNKLYDPDKDSLKEWFEFKRDIILWWLGSFATNVLVFGCLICIPLWFLAITFHFYFPFSIFTFLGAGIGTYSLLYFKKEFKIGR